MAIAWRIEPNGVSIPADGSVSIKFTAGLPPLRAAWGGETMTFSAPSGREDFAAAIKRVVAKLDPEDWVLLQAAKAFKLDPTLGPTFKLNAEGKTGSFDPEGLTATVVLG